MKTKFKLIVSVLVGLGLFFQPIYVAIPQEVIPSSYVNCEEEVSYFLFNSTASEVFDVECPLCELTKIENVYDGNGLLLGTAYTYDLGSEPEIWLNVECQYSIKEEDRCTQYIVTTTGTSCNGLFIPCTKEDDAECFYD